MRLLLDNNISPHVVPTLQQAGHDVVHLRDRGLASAPDDEVLRAAREEQRVLISADTDFGTLLARTGASRPSIVLLRRTQGRRHGQIADLLLANLPALAADLEAGVIVVIREDNVRLRRLPFAPGH